MFISPPFVVVRIQASRERFIRLTDPAEGSKKVTDAPDRVAPTPSPVGLDLLFTFGDYLCSVRYPPGPTCQECSRSDLSGMRPVCASRTPPPPPPIDPIPPQ